MAINKQIITNLRQKYGDNVLAKYTDLQLYMTWSNWSMSEDYGNDESLLVWLQGDWDE